MGKQLRWRFSSLDGVTFFADEGVLHLKEGGFEFGSAQNGSY